MRYCPQCGAVSEAAVCANDGTPTVRRVASVRGDLVAGEVIGARYRVVGVLGRGGFGTVYEAEHVTTGHAVALKVLAQQPGAEGEELARRFFKEAATTSRLSHPNTVRVFDFGQTERGDLFLAMERLVGETLQDRLSFFARAKRRMDEDEAVEIGVAVLRSLGEAHAHGLVHRDLKPANIFLHEVAGGEAIVKVLDFGIVKEVDATMTQAGKAIGTPTHMSPEQAMGRQVDARCDLYALGVLLYECLTGALPFYADSPLAIVMMQVTEPVPPIESRAPGVVRPAIAAVVERALAKEPDERWPDAAAMRVALQKALRTPARAPLAEDTTTSVGPVPTMTPVRPMEAAAPAPAAAPRAPLATAAPRAASPAPSAPSAPSTGPAASVRPPPSAPPTEKASIRVRLLPRQRPPSTRVEVSEGATGDEATAVGRPAMLDDEPPAPRPPRPARALRPEAPAPAPAAGKAEASELAFRQQPTVHLDAVEPPALAPAPAQAKPVQVAPSIKVAPSLLAAGRRAAEAASAATSPPAVSAHRAETVAPVAAEASPAPTAAPVEPAVDADAASVSGAVEAPRADDSASFMVIGGAPDDADDGGADEGDADDASVVSPSPGAEAPTSSPLQRVASSRLVEPARARPAAARDEALGERPSLANSPFARHLAALGVAPPSRIGGMPPRPDLSALSGLGSRGMVDRLAHDLQRMTDALRARTQESEQEHAGQVSALWLNDDLRAIAIGTRGGALRLVQLDAIGDLPTLVGDGSDGIEVGEHKGAVIGVVGAGDGRGLLSIGLDGAVRAWSIAECAERAALELDAAPSSMAVSHDGRLLVVGCADGSVSLIDLPELELRRVLRGHREAVTAVALASSRRSVVTGSEDGSVRTWDPVGGGARLTSRHHGAQIGAVALSRDGRWIASGGWDGRLLVWSARSGEIRHDVAAHGDVIAGAAFAAGGDFVATASDDGSVRVWRSEDGRQHAERAGLDSGAKVVRFGEDTRFAYLATWGGQICRVPVMP